MNQPADPVAFSRFTEGLSGSGDPDHDPSAFVAANGINPELLPREESPSPAVPAPAVPGVEEAPPAVETGAVDLAEAGGAVETGVVAIDTESPETEDAAAAAETGALASDTEPPEAGDAVDAIEIVDTGAETGDAVETSDAAEAIPPEDDRITAAGGFEETEPSVPEEETAVVTNETGSESLEDLTIVDLPEPYVPPASPKPDEGITPETNPELVWIPSEETAGEELVEPKPEDRAEVTDLIPADGEADGLAGTGDIIEPGEDLAEDTPGPEETAEGFPGDYELTLEPAEERPPESPETIIPADQIFPPAAETGTALTPPPPEGEPPSLPPGPVESAGAYGFPVPVITELEEGKYYLQLAASRNQDAVKTELAKIGEYWPLAVQVSERDSYPYRILVGPVNQGESRALLQRFKGTYQDAFVRHGD
jgi:hypothetical protein